eukprot:TRINITY_DN2626_c0_g1_i1.p1 TRINITY_DN2626_c0_g1~~TRINITY_DN2626_c0_g1_i1.p1  ORF type:complete len:142 (+),score=26.40 TRINITY_DN2626_c0_g1_i1:285-710(+)
MVRVTILVLAVALFVAICLPLGGKVDAAANKYAGKTHYNAFVAALTKKKKYTSYLKYLQSTGFNKTLIDVLNNYEVTVLAFSNAALQKSNTAKNILKDPKKAAQLMGYNAISGKHTFELLLKYPNNVEVRADKVEGIWKEA